MRGSERDRQGKRDKDVEEGTERITEEKERDGQGARQRELRRGRGRMWRELERASALSVHKQTS